jgi:hypothetical protein
MALRLPARTRSATATAGSGTYTLTEPTSDGWRNLTQAVADGDLADADQVAYCVVDTTVVGDVVLEIGLGTWDNTAKTLTRDTVHQPNATAVSWGAGTRDVLVIDPVMLAVLTLGDQTVAGVKTFTSVVRAQLAGTPFGADSSTPLVVQNSGTAGATCRAAIIAGNTGVSDLDFGDTDNQYAARIFFTHSTEVLSFLTAGSVRASLSSAGLKDAAGNPYIALPVGGRILWGTNSIPPGWAIVAALAEKIILTTSTASEIDDTGGSWSVSGVTIGNTALSIAQMPAHTHAPAAGGSFLTTSGAIDMHTAGTQKVGNDAATASTGSGSAHTHTFAQDGTWRPAYYKAGWIQKS